MSVPITPGSGTTIAADVIGTPAPPTTGQQLQYVKLDLGVAGASSPATAANPVPVQVGNGTQTMPTMDAVARPGFVKLTDGTGTAAFDNGNTTPKASAYGKGTVAGDTPMPALDAPAHAGYVRAVPDTANGLTPYHLISAATTNATNVKGTAGQVFGVQVFNTNATARFLKFFDKATAPIPGTDTPVKTILVPGNSPGGGGAIIQQPLGIAFANGIGFATTVNIADNDATAVGAGDLAVNIDYH
jgi:hypothetical protein